jgi:hypothetical protein
MNLMPSIDADELPVAAVRDSDELWYKDAVIYQLHVKAFADSNNDGIGDFAGLTEKLDYLQALGVTALWLLPFYPSPGRDDGYDIADYGAINPDFGTSTTGSSARAAAIRSRTRATGMCGATPTRNTPAPALSSPTPRSRTGPGIPKPAPSIGIASSRISRI